MPSHTAAAAPGKPTRARVWPAKLCRRSTMNQPTRAASTATMVPARNALTMKSSDHMSRMSASRFQVNVAVMPGRRAARGAVQAGQGLGGDDLAGGAGHGASVAEVDDPVHEGEDRVDIVRDDHHGDVLCPGDAGGQGGHGGLVG